MKAKLTLLCAAAAVVLFASLNMQAQLSPVGTWKTISDKTGKATSHMKVYERNGTYYGKIMRLLDEPNQGKDSKCTACSGRFKDKAILGMTIMWGLKHDDDNEYSSGRIMDPDNGKIYRCTIEVQNGGKKLRVRGYIGISLFGRNQFWYRLK